MLNQITIMGRLTKDPELRVTNSNIKVASFSIACERDMKGQDGNKGVDFIDCVAWRQTAEFISKYFMRGKPILIVGRLQMRDWQDKNGNKRRSYEVVVDTAHFCGGDKVNTQAAPANVGAVLDGATPSMAELDDIDVPWEDHDLK